MLVHDAAAQRDSAQRGVRVRVLLRPIIACESMIGA